MSVDHDLMVGGVPFGHRPGLIVVDMSLGFTSPDSPLGGNFDTEVEAARQLMARFHRYGLPVFLSTVVYRDTQSQSVFRQHLPDLNILQAQSHWVDIDPRLQPQPSDIIVEKTAPSAFFATSLPRLLTEHDCDSVMVCGLTTSGCVRATVVDALQYNYPTWVVKDACGDRNQTAQAANFHDMHAKYARVVTLTDAIAGLNKITKE